MDVSNGTDLAQKVLKVGLFRKSSQLRLVIEPDIYQRFDPGACQRLEKFLSRLFCKSDCEEFHVRSKNLPTKFELDLRLAPPASLQIFAGVSQFEARTCHGPGSSIPNDTLRLFTGKVTQNRCGNATIVFTVQVRSLPPRYAPATWLGDTASLRD